MLFEDLTIEEIVAIRCEEAREEGREDGLQKGHEMGREEGREEGREDGQRTIARNLLAKGSAPEFVSEITGLSLEEIAKL